MATLPRRRKSVDALRTDAAPQHRFKRPGLTAFRGWSCSTTDPESRGQDSCSSCYGGPAVGSGAFGGNLCPIADRACCFSCSCGCLQQRVMTSLCSCWATTRKIGDRLIQSNPGWACNYRKIVVFTKQPSDTRSGVSSHGRRGTSQITTLFLKSSLKMFRCLWPELPHTWSKPSLLSSANELQHSKLGVE